MNPCRVCELLDDDATPKPTIYCGFCGAFLCEQCRGNWGRRSRAAMMELYRGKR